MGKQIREEAYEMQDRLNTVIERFEVLIIKEPGSWHPEASYAFEYNGVNCRLMKNASKKLVLREDSTGNERSVRSELSFPMKLAAAKYLPSFLDICVEFTRFYSEIAKRTITDLEEYLQRYEK